MKSKILLGIITLGLLTSCSTAFKNGQTPDDVYYSPVKEGVEEIERKQDNSAKEDDNYLRMKVRRNTRWSQIDDYTYWNDSRYNYNYCNNFYTNKNSFNGWNNYYSYNSYNNCNCNCSWGNSWTGWGGTRDYWNNHFYVVNYKNPNIYKGSTAASNITAYKNKSYSNTNTTYTGKPGTSYSNSSNGFGGLVRRVFTPATNGSAGSSYDRPARTFGSSSSTSTNTQPSTSSSAGGNSGGYNSTGSSSSGGRAGRN